jgi:thymidylate kinase
VSGSLFVFEGGDGAGKSTLCAAVAAELRASGTPVSVLSFPGRQPGTLGALVYELHHDAQSVGVEAVTPTALQLLHIAAHLDAIEREILPRLAAGETVLLDRYWWSTWTYGITAGAERAMLGTMIELERMCWRSVEPIAVFLIERGQDQADSTPVAVEYRALASREARSIVIDNSGEFGQTVETVLAFIASSGRPSAASIGAL